METVELTQKVDSIGRIAIPKPVREALKINAGDLIVFEIRKIIKVENPEPAKAQG